MHRGGSLEAARVLAGHSRLDITQRYAHATAQDLEAAIARLGASGKRGRPDSRNRLFLASK